MKKQGQWYDSVTFLKKRFADSGKIPTFAVPSETEGMRAGDIRKRALKLFSENLWRYGKDSYLCSPFGNGGITQKKAKGAMPGDIVRNVSGGAEVL